MEIIRLATASMALIRSPVRDDAVKEESTWIPAFASDTGNMFLGKLSRIGKRRGVWKLYLWLVMAKIMDLHWAGLTSGTWAENCEAGVYDACQGQYLLLEDHHCSSARDQIRVTPGLG